MIVIIILHHRIRRRYWRAARNLEPVHKLLVRVGQDSYPRHQSPWLPPTFNAFTADPLLTIDLHSCLITAHHTLSLLSVHRVDSPAAATRPDPSFFAHGRTRAAAKGTKGRTSCPSRPVIGVCREAPPGLRATLDVLPRPRTHTSLIMTRPVNRPPCRKTVPTKTDHHRHHQESSFHRYLSPRT